MISVMSLLMMVSCNDKIQTTKGKITQIKKDTTMVLRIDKYDITIDVHNVEYKSGAVMPGDSVVMEYMGNLRDKSVQAVALSLIPPKGTFIHSGYDPSKELKTAKDTVTKNAQQRLDAFMKMSKANGH